MSETSLPELRIRLKRLRTVDRARLGKRLDSAGRIASPTKRREALAVLAEEIQKADALYERRRSAVPNRLDYPQELPITARRRELLEAIRDNQVVVVAGETGSGKSTQLPKMCLEAGRGVEGYIGHTQPRRIAARSLAARVAEEIGSPLGETVGFAVRFSEQVSETTLVKLMTDGLLLAEIHNDRVLSKYDTIIVDEAHERSLNIDFLLGYLHRLLPKRPDLKVIITSATIDTARFAHHFHDAPVVEVSGRTYPVELRYRPLDGSGDDPKDQPDGICDAVKALIHDGDGDILVFCSGEREISDAAEAVGEMGLRHTEILPLYARLTVAEQSRVFAPHTGRRIILATNVAETSLTVPGIRYVVDPGTARISRYSRRTKVQRLPIEPISRASANQRAGRCGRIGPGICIRLYSEADFLGRDEYTEPEIRRTNLASVILQMAAIGLGEVEDFPFLDPPDSRSIRDGIALLEELGAVDLHKAGKPGFLTAIGRKLADFPVDPRLGRILIAGHENGCLREVLVIVSALSIQDPRERPREKEAQADQMHARYRHPGSDLLGWILLWKHVRDARSARTSSQFRKMCREEYLNYWRVREWQDLHMQLREVCAEMGMRPSRREAEEDLIHKSLLAGLLSHVGRKDPEGFEYRGARDARFSIAPGSALFKKAPQWVMAADLVETTRMWARGVAEIDPAWIEKIGSHLIRKSYSDPWWDSKKGSALVNETVTIYGLPLFEVRPVQFGRIDKAAARELFIRHALVYGEWNPNHRFWDHNASLIREVKDMESRKRSNDLLISEDAIFDLYEARIPQDVVSVAHFEKWWKDAKGRKPDLLNFDLEDLIEQGADVPAEEDFPDYWQHGNIEMPVHYKFRPGVDFDGVTIDVPVWGLDRIDPAVFEWHVPGMRLELVTALIRTLPKSIRKEFVPIPETAAAVLERLDFGAGGLLENLRRVLSRMIGEMIALGSFDVGSLPPHLKPTFRVVDEDGAVLAEGPDLAELRAELLHESRNSDLRFGHEIEGSGYTEWVFGELPQEVEIKGPGHSVSAYPALVDEGESVGIRVLATREEQADAMWNGTRRLLMLSLPAPSKILKPLLTEESRYLINVGPYESSVEWVEDVLDCALGKVLIESEGFAWDAVAFDALRNRVRILLDSAALEVGEQSLEILDWVAAVQARWVRLPEAFSEAGEDIKRQLSRLIYPRFLSAVGHERLPDLVRYLKAVDRRLERMVTDIEWDRKRMAQIRRLEDEHDRLLASLPWSQDLVEIGWMIQEFRVSLFAQQVGVKGQISEKRIRKAIEKAILN